MHDTTLGLRKLFALALIILLPTLSLAQTRRAPAFDVIIRGGTVYDGSGGPPRRADVGIRGDRIAAIGNLKTATAATVIDATNLAVAPGFINMLSWSTESLIIDGRSQGELPAGQSMFALVPRLARIVQQQGQIEKERPFDFLKKLGVFVERRVLRLPNPVQLFEAH